MGKKKETQGGDFIPREDYDFTTEEDSLEDKSTPQSDEVILTFKFNRKYSLHVGREITIFEGTQSHPVPRSYLEHKDFTTQVSDMFVIQEVE